MHFTDLCSWLEDNVKLVLSYDAYHALGTSIVPNTRDSFYRTVRARESDHGVLLWGFL